MQKYTPKEGGGIAAIIGLDQYKVIDVCNEISSNKDSLVNAANLNSPTQIVISGTKKGVSLAMDKCKEIGARRSVHLPMSVPAHSELMKPAADKFSKFLDEITFLKPKIPILHNVDSSLCEDPVQIKDKLTKQIYSSVLWTDTVNEIIKLGVDKIYECGPGKVLIGSPAGSHFFTIFLICSLVAEGIAIRMISISLLVQISTTLSVTSKTFMPCISD